MSGQAQQQEQQPASVQTQSPGGLAPTPAANGSGGGSNGAARSGGCPPHVLAAIYGKPEDKKAAYEASLQRWWTEYADRKNDEEEEYVSNSLLYDRRHLPRTAPAPDCVQRAMAAAPAATAAGQPPTGAAAPGAAPTEASAS